MTPAEPSNWRRAELARLAEEIWIICNLMDAWARRPTPEEVWTELHPNGQPTDYAQLKRTRES
jgi:hypothetical protein